MAFSLPHEIFSSRLNDHPAKEGLSPYKITIAMFIRDYCLLRNQCRYGLNNIGTLEDVFQPKFRRCFATLAVQLIQGEDMELSEFQELLKVHEDSLLPLHLEKFEVNLVSLYMSGLDSLKMLMEGLDDCISEPSLLKPMISKFSFIGMFFRRTMVLFEKLTFAQMVSTFEAFRTYADKYYITCPLSDVPKGETGKEMNVCDLAGPSVETPLVVATSKDEADESRHIQRYSTRRQADLFFAQQANSIISNDPEALLPPDLQQRISELTITHPEYADAHYLSYLNCVRTREFTGALDSLYHCFDRSAAASDTKFTSPEDRCHGSRYASLNLAMLCAQFGHKKEALVALKEAIRMAHELNDNVCLQHALAWLYKLTNENQEVYMERLISKSTDLNLHHLSSLGIQSFAQHAGLSGGKPALVFDLLLKSDSLNTQNSMVDLTCNSYAVKSALWSLYGKTDMMSINSQLLLNLQTTRIGPDSKEYNGEGSCKAMCNVANVLLEKGNYQGTFLIVEFARKHFPYEPVSNTWMICEQIAIFTRALHHETWKEAEQALVRLATLDKWESQLRKAELCLARCDFPEGMACVRHLLDSGLMDDVMICPSIRARAMILEADIHCSSSSIRAAPATGIELFLSSLNFAKLHHLDYLAAMVGLHVANLQFQMNLPTQGIALIDQHLLTVLTNGGLYDQGRGLLLLIKCKVAATAGGPPATRHDVLVNAALGLEKVKENFSAIESYGRVKDVLYLQGLFYNELENYEERNRCAREYRLLDEQYPMNNLTALVTRL